MIVRPMEIRNREGLPKRKPDDFGYEVDKGLVGATVYGGRERGKTYFHITWRRAWCMLLPWLSCRHNGEIKSILFDNGAKEIDVDEWIGESEPATRGDVQ
jgi:hypothetical protein